MWPTCNGQQNPESRIQNPESRIQNLKIQNPESRIQNHESQVHQNPKFRIRRDGAPRSEAWRLEWPRIFCPPPKFRIWELELDSSWFCQNSRAVRRMQMDWVGGDMGSEDQNPESRIMSGVWGGKKDRRIQNSESKMGAERFWENKRVKTKSRILREESMCVREENYQSEMIAELDINVKFFITPH